MPWTVELHDEFLAEFSVLPRAVQDELLARAKILERFGPSLGRPAVDTIQGSQVPNLKELRFDADNGVWRVLFAFNRSRIAVLLVAGDKKGANQRRFYRSLITTAEARWFGTD